MAQELPVSAAALCVFNPWMQALVCCPVVLPCPHLPLLCCIVVPRRCCICCCCRRCLPAGCYTLYANLLFSFHACMSASALPGACGPLPCLLRHLLPAYRHPWDLIVCIAVLHAIIPWTGIHDNILYTAILHPVHAIIHTAITRTAIR